MLFDSLHIKNFRGVKDLTLSGFKQLNIFVGDNAIGKTTLLDALYIGINPNNPELILRTNVFRKMDYIENINEDFWSTFFYDFDFKNTIHLDFEGEKSRKVDIEPLRSSFVQNFNVASKRDFSNAALETDPLMGIKINFEVNKRNFKSIYYKKGLDELNIEYDKDFVEDLKGTYLNNYTYIVQNIFHGFDNIVNSKNKRKLIHHLKAIEPNIEDINRVKNSIKIDDSRFSKAVDICTYGDGFFRSFQILSSILGHDEQYICLLDEIENGLFYSKQSLVWKIVVAFLKEIPNEQVFVATHSREMIKNLQIIAQEMDFLDQISLFRVEKNKRGDLQAFRYSASQFQYAMEENLEIR